MLQLAGAARVQRTPVHQPAHQCSLSGQHTASGIGQQPQSAHRPTLRAPPARLDGCKRQRRSAHTRVIYWQGGGSGPYVKRCRLPGVWSGKAGFDSRSGRKKLCILLQN